MFTTTAPTDTYTLSLHDALPICARLVLQESVGRDAVDGAVLAGDLSLVNLLPESAGRPAQAIYAAPDRKSTRLNSSHLVISYAVFCLKKKNMLRNSCNYHRDVIE